MAETTERVYYIVRDGDGPLRAVKKEPTGETQKIYTLTATSPTNALDRFRNRFTALIAAIPRKPESRPDRWRRAASEAVAALEELKDVQDEYQEWRDNLPDNMESSPVAEKLDAVVEIDIESALEAANEADGADLPLGFGRD